MGNRIGFYRIGPSPSYFPPRRDGTGSPRIDSPYLFRSLILMRLKTTKGVLNIFNFGERVDAAFYEGEVKADFKIWS